MVLAKSAPDLMQRLTRLPTSPHVALLLRGKPKPSPWSHKHHLLKAAIYQMVLRRPFEPAPQIGQVKFYKRRSQEKNLSQGRNFSCFAAQLIERDLF
jgi:hypothetical protein